MLQTANETVRRDALLKVEGKAEFNDDYCSPSCLQARLLTSEYAHAEIVSIDTSQVWTVPGVQVAITGASAVHSGSVIQDMPVLAVGKTRYYGEPVALVVAQEEWQAAQAVKLIKVEYKPLPLVNSIDEALKPDAELVHTALGEYNHISADVYPELGTNISNRTRIRKGNMAQGWANSEVIAEGVYNMPQANHSYMETRNSRVKISPDGRVDIYSASQGPHASRALIANILNIPEGKIVIHTPFVGGAYGGKVNPHIDILAYLASRAVGGCEVRLSLTREESFYSTPCKIGAKAVIKLGSDRSGKLQALKADFYIDSGAYADTSPIMSRAAAVSCSGAYYIPFIECDSISVYTNHVYTTSFRGFGHEVSTFAIERTIEKLAVKLDMDSADLRAVNAIREGDYTPTQVKVTLSNSGNVKACIEKLKQAIEWDNGIYLQDENTVRAKGIACFKKTSSSPTDVVSTAVITFCSDGCVNLNCSVVECGTGATTALPQILSEKLKIPADRIFMNLEIDTHANPEHWKTVASMSSYLAGNAVLKAADDVISQLKENAALAMRCVADDIEFDGSRAYLKEDPEKCIELKNIVNGVKTEEGNALGHPVIGRGYFTMKHLSALDNKTGEGRPGPYCTVGAQAVEDEYDKIEHSYRLIRAATVIDAGTVINAACASGQVIGAMSMGLSLATREENFYTPNAEVLDTSFRTYKVMHYAEQPQYIVDFVETPNISGPFSVRGIAEHGILGMPPALANALSKAAGIELDSLPITFEAMWNAAQNTTAAEAR